MATSVPTGFWPRSIRQRRRDDLVVSLYRLASLRPLASWPGLAAMGGRASRIPSPLERENRRTDPYSLRRLETPSVKPLITP